jgi:ABC-type polysaccharide/polyol phosphate export permease
VQGFQWAVLGVEPRPDGAMVVSLVVSLLLLAVSVMYFRRFENTFADVI